MTQQNADKVYEYVKEEHKRYRKAINQGKGEYGTASYVRDETWAGYWAADSIYSYLIKMFEETVK